MDFQNFFNQVGQTKDFPKQLWQHFFAIMAIPRPSGKEASISQFVFDFGKGQGFETEKDSANNVLIKVPASSDVDDNKGLVFQSHLDMVVDKAPDVDIDPEKDGLRALLSEDKKWLTADRTTLGADNGIGIAAMMALAQRSKDFSHGPLAFLFTTDEETGLNGAREVSFDLSAYDYLVNLDSEQLMEMTIGCAGGGDTLVYLPVEYQSMAQGNSLLSFDLTGLCGGHSGVDIHLVGKDRANAIKLIVRVLKKFNQEGFDYQLVEWRGGNKRNQVPNNARLILSVDQDKVESAKKVLSQIAVSEINKFSEEKKARVAVTEIDKKKERGLTEFSLQNLLGLMDKLPNGVISWSQSVDGLVDTSTNLAIVEPDRDKYQITLMSRSANEDRLAQLREKMDQVVSAVDKASIKHESTYPGWDPNPENELVSLTQSAAEKALGQKLEVIAIHAGLECGILSGKYPHLEAVSIGPTIEGAHTVEEKVNISSVTAFFNLLLGLSGS